MIANTSGTPSRIQASCVQCDIQLPPIKVRQAGVRSFHFSDEEREMERLTWLGSDLVEIQDLDLMSSLSVLNHQ